MIDRTGIDQTGIDQTGIDQTGIDQTGLYLHIPFCAQKCPYCDFNTYAGLDAYFQQTVDALCAEMNLWSECLQDRVLTTVFIGGGTPTILSETQLGQLFHTLRRAFRLSPNCEISCEANPGTVDQRKFDCLRAVGVNRLSIGVQSMQPAELQFLGRIHDTTDVTAAFAAARNAGFDNINLDFIFGLPGQEPSAWQATLAAACELAPEHLSLYSLIVEPNTPLYHWVTTGKVADTDEDLAAELYEIAMATLGKAGYQHYEVSNWAQSQATARRTAQMPEFACKHNLIYWRNQDYLGIGPGAHSHLRLSTALSDAPTAPTMHPSAVSTCIQSHQYEYRWGNRKAVPGYIKRLARGASVTEFREEIVPRLAMGETMMLGLRLLQEGVAFQSFQTRHNADLREVFAKEIAELQQWGLLTIDAERIKLSARGLLLGNQVFSYFLPEE